jgi:hypothetical protein
LFAIAVFALFCARTPAEILLGISPLHAQTTAERRRVRAVFSAFTGVALLTLTGLLWDGRNNGLLWLGAVCGVLFLWQSLLRRCGRQERVAAQLVGSLGLTASAAGAYYVASGHLNLVMLALWITNWMFVGNQVQFVQLRIRGARLQNRRQKFGAGRVFFASQFMMILMLGCAARLGMLPGTVIAAFLPVFVRGLVWFFRRPQPLRIHYLGLTELGHALVFGVLLIASYRG